MKSVPLKDHSAPLHGGGRGEETGQEGVVRLGDDPISGLRVTSEPGHCHCLAGELGPYLITAL